MSENPNQRINPYKRYRGIFIPNSLVECKKVSQSAKILWGRLAYHAGEDGRCFPKVKTLSEGLGLSIRQVRSLIQELVKIGLIEVEKPTGKSRLKHHGCEYYFLDSPLLNDEKCTSGGEENFTSGSEEDFTRGVKKTSPPIQEKKLREKKEEKYTYGIFENVHLTKSEYEKLTTRFGVEETMEKIERLSEYVESKGKHYKNHYATILSWARRDDKPASNSKQNSDFTGKPLV